MIKNRRSNKWAFLLYQDSMPNNYLEILERMRVPYAISPWHDMDVNKETGEILKAHKHGVLFFDSLKSYSQVSELLTENLNTPAHVEIVMSPSGLYNISHMQIILKKPSMMPMISNAVVGLIEKNFILGNDHEFFLAQALDVIDTMGFVEFGSLVSYARAHDPNLLRLIMNKSYFFARLIDSKRHSKYENNIENLKSISYFRDLKKLKKNRMEN